VTARWLTVASAALAWFIAERSAWAYPVEIYWGSDLGWGSVVCCGAMAIPWLLILALAQWDNKRLRWGLLLTALACAAAIVPARRSAVTHVVTAVSERELRVDLRQSGRPVRVGRERVAVTQVWCAVRRSESCDREGENCNDVFDDALLRDGMLWVPQGSGNYTNIGVAHGRCQQLAAYGIRQQPGP